MRIAQGATGMTAFHHRKIGLVGGAIVLFGGNELNYMKKEVPI